MPLKRVHNPFDCAAASKSRLKRKMFTLAVRIYKLIPEGLNNVFKDEVMLVVLVVLVIESTVSVIRNPKNPKDQGSWDARGGKASE